MGIFGQSDGGPLGPALMMAVYTTQTGEVKVQFY